MRQREAHRGAKSVAQVRALQRLSAEAEVVRANIRLNDVERRRGEAAKALLACEDSWAASLSGAAVDLSITGFWSQAVDGAESDLSRVAGEVAAAEARQMEARQGWRSAIALSDAAEDFLKGAARRLRQRSEETALDEAADRILHRYVGP